MPTAIVTGCSTGIGFATALRLAREGCRVHASVRSEASGAALAEAAGDLPVALLVLDVDDDESVAGAVGSVIAAEGGIDILVNNAGVGSLAAIEDTPMELFASVMNTNAWGTVRCTQAVLPTMRAQRGGCIVNVTSIVGRVALGGQAAYSASKWATEGFSEALAVEVAPFGIRVAIVEPGVVATPIYAKSAESPPDFGSPYAEATMRTARYLMAGLGDPATPDDIAATVWHAISTDQPTLRHPAGRDAQAIAARRPGISDEDWIAALATPDDDEWRAGIREWTGTDVPPLG